ncbi:MAG: dTDP-glucose 4,6-dehydratase [Chloroflexi bacterium]|nr:dTDP-glucose 4,6-dehydratase [Chloroflexota bacterium]MCI0577524.1 dTDP-glucose 4,6-dehydratase [Chloroflexota bacterium]MCI0645637.1 dTDP-glucose 4,6-dehydratase [Chloroflexota bacterium]MCI0725549.1 dTDP-glucose 4,6-dehydratase [Chloroflexota bacterium]
MKNILVAGGAGFIGSNFVVYMLNKYPNYHLVVYDKLTYAGNLDNLLEVSDEPRYHFVKGDIGDAAAVEAAVRDYNVDTIVNFAAETHVDRSITNPDAFIQTNVYGTYVLLEAARRLGLERVNQVSTDEVYGHVPHGASSVETDPLAPRSPYAASKASGDLMALAFYTTYGLPVTITRGANNVGPYQYPEKAVPLFATNAIDHQPLPVYGDGRQMRDYQWVGDHCAAIDVVLHQGKMGEVYNVGTGQAMENLAMIEILLKALERPASLVRHVKDRPGHDRRYSLNVDKIKALGWEPRYTLVEAITMTAHWYRDNEWWWRKIKSGDYQVYYQAQYGERLREAAGEVME